MKLIAILILPFCVFCQTKVEPIDTFYVDKFLNPVKKKVAEFYVTKETIERNNEYWTFYQKTFYLNGTLKDECKAKQEYNNPKKTFPYRFGVGKSYYPNGQLECENSYEYGSKRGPFTSYFRNGNIESKGNIVNFDKIYLYAHFDSLGNSHLNNGNGTVCEFDSTLNCNSYKAVTDSLILYSYHIDNIHKDTIYDLIDTKVEPLQGWQKFFEQMAEPNIRRWKIRKFTGNRLLIEFIVFEDGKTGRVTALNSLSEKLDDEFIKEVKRIAVFNEPRLKNGKRVRVRYVLPLRMG